MIKNLFNKFVETFLNRAFITFCVIGVINTGIHYVMYTLLYLNFHVITANTLAFICASMFSYWANSRFTFNEKMESRTFWYTMLTFVGRLLISNVLTLLFDKLIIELGLDNLRSLAPIIASVIVIPVQFIFLKLIFKKETLKIDHQA